MSDDRDDLLSAFGRATEPTRDEVVALRRALARRTDDLRVSRALLRHLPDTTPHEVDALRRDLRGRRRATRWAPIALGAASIPLLAAAAAAVGFAVWTFVGEGPPAPLDVALDDAAATPTAIAPGVALTWSGGGTVEGTTRAPQIRWTQGTIGVEVEPNQGIALTVVTREAEVRVIGTVFDVVRDALGTRVDVSRGTVGVRCASGSDHVLHAGDTVTCAPTTAPGLLGRANALKAADAAPAEILAAVEAGLPVATGPFVGELTALRAETLAKLGRHEEALSAAEMYLAAGGPRRLDVLAIAAGSALESRGCAAALPYLQALEEQGAGDAELLDRCEAAP